MDAETALRIAVQEQSEDRVVELLQNADIDLFNSKILGNDLLFSAVSKKGNEKIIEALLTCGAKPYYQVMETALLWYDERIIEELLKHGESSLLLYCSQFDNRFVWKKRKYNYTSDTLNILSKYYYLGNYPQYNLLHEVARAPGDKAKVCEILIKHGVKVNQESLHCRRTPLYYAIERKNINVISNLLRYGAEPLRAFDGPYGVTTPLEYVFSLPTTTVKNIIKYAALQLNYSCDMELYSFFSYFSKDRCKSEQYKMFHFYARKCVAEAVSLKKFQIYDDPNLTLHDLAVYFRNKQNSDCRCTRSQALCDIGCKDANVINRVFGHLVSNPFIIYTDIILQHFSEDVIISKIAENSGGKWSVTVQDKKMFFDTFCVERICKLLTKSDLVNMFIAFTVFPKECNGKRKRMH